MKIENNLAVLPSHDTTLEIFLWFFLFLWLLAVLCHMSEFVTVVTLELVSLFVVSLLSYFYWFAHFSVGYS